MNNFIATIFATNVGRKDSSYYNTIIACVNSVQEGLDQNFKESFRAKNEFIV